ncbi:hypothetical protein V0288_01855 [Pannus brasiliensis CCIBt3594]|uniref:Uncharacterized protein n=1 Tax=Pannus brasiliensis CCIBt3594 TaxID=1427578 RepID=A0AAW9QSK2_9CHRO
MVRGVRSQEAGGRSQEPGNQILSLYHIFPISPISLTSPFPSPPPSPHSHLFLALGGKVW